MKYVCKITRSKGQARITLPKHFIENRGLEKSNYVVIDDRSKGQAIIRGTGFEENNDKERKAGAVRPDRRTKRSHQVGNRSG